MDLIEVLWKQDVDLGFTLVESPAPIKKTSSASEKESADEIEKLKALEAINATSQKVREELSHGRVDALAFYLSLSLSSASSRFS